jgi:hypothetical protein
MDDLLTIFEMIKERMELSEIVLYALIICVLCGLAAIAGTLIFKVLFWGLRYLVLAGILLVVVWGGYKLWNNIMFSSDLDGLISRFSEATKYGYSICPPGRDQFEGHFDHIHIGLKH